MQALSKISCAVVLTVLSLAAAGAAKDKPHRYGAADSSSSPAICDSPCWVWIYSEPNFQGENDVLCGPFKRGELRQMPSADNKDWASNIGSMRVGPRATLRVWEDENFEGPSFFVEASVAIPNLEAANREQVESMELFCWKLNLGASRRD